MSRKAVAKLLENEWEPTIEGRVLDVPKPFITRESIDFKERLSTKDVIKVADGGGEDHEALGFSWTHKDISSRVALEIRSATRRQNGEYTDGEDRMYGVVGEGDLGPYEEERYGGLVGEVERILDAHRKGFGQYELVGESLTINDEAGATGVNHFRVDVVFGLRKLSEEIDSGVTKS